MSEHRRSAFHPGVRKLTENEKLIGRSALIDRLDQHIIDGINLCILGVWGVGKSLLLSEYFTDEQCKNLFENYKMITIQIDLIDCGDKDIQWYIADRLIRAAKKQNLILDVPENEDASTFFDDTMECLKSNGYTGILVMDAFEKFLSSNSITLEHHDKLAVATRNRCLSIIVSTDRNLDQESQTPGVRGSYLIELLTERMTVEGWDKNCVVEFCDERLEGTGVTFPDKAIERLMEFTGGIPFFIETAFKKLYMILKDDYEESDIENIVDEVESDLYFDVRVHLERWCESLNETQWKVLYRCAKVLKEKTDEDKWSFIPYETKDYNPENSEKTALAMLDKRGLLIKHPKKMEYKFNSLMFQKYVLGLLDELSDNEPKGEIVNNPQDSYTEKKGNIIVQPGGILNLYSNSNIDQSHNVVENNTVNNLEIMRYDDILKVLSGSFENAAYNKLVQNWQDQIAENTKEIEDPEVRLSLAADVITGGIKEEEDLKKNEETIKTLDGLFKKASAELEVDCEETLRGMSSLCKFYLKHAIVVDNALKTLDFLGSEADCSPRLVMYGKVLETSLRDNFYDFFHNHPNFKDHNTMQYSNRPKFCFGQKTKSDTMIGNYRYMIKQKKGALAALCNSNGINDKTVQWWDCLLTDLKICNDKRNKADHGKEKKNEPSPMPEDVDTFRKLLLNGEACEDGVLKCLKIGRELANKTVYNRRN